MNQQETPKQNNPDSIEDSRQSRNNSHRSFRLTQSPFKFTKKATVQSLTYIIAAFGLVSALAWNEAIKALINTLVKKENTLISLFFYAIAVTIAAVLATARLNSLAEKFKEEAENKEG